MPVWMTGVDHNRAALDVRGEFSFTKKKMKEAFDAFRSIPGLAGCVILSTCNRMEGDRIFLRALYYNEDTKACRIGEADGSSCKNRT